MVLRMSSVMMVLGGEAGPVMLMSAPMVVKGQTWEDVGSGEKKMSKGRAVGSERRCNCDSMPSGVFGYKYPACVRAGDRASANSVAMTLWARFLLPLSQWKAWSPKMSCVWWPQVHGVLCG